MCYRNNTNSSYLYSLVLTISGTTITASTPVQCNSHISSYISTTLLSTNKVLVCYRNDSDSGYLYSLVLTISGTNITASTPVPCNSHNSQFISTVLLSTDKVLVCYGNVSNNYYLYALVLTISGTTITASTPVQCNSHNSYHITTTLLSTNKALVCYSNNTNSRYLYSLVLTISGTSITASTSVQCNSHDSYYISTTSLSTDKVLVCYQNITNSGYLYSLVLTISGTTITASTPVPCNSHNSHHITTTLLSTNKVLVYYRNYTNGNYLYSLVLTISSTTITASTPVQCNSHYSNYITTTLLSTDKVLVCYSNNSGYLYSLVLTGS